MLTWMCMAVPSLQANMEYFNISGFFSLALSLSVRTNLLSSVKISAQKCNGFAVSSNYKGPDCMSVLSLWLHQKSAGEWAMFGLLNFSLISIFSQSSVKSTQGQNSWLCCALKTAGAGLHIAVSSFWLDQNWITLHGCSVLSPPLFWYFVVQEIMD